MRQNIKKEFKSFEEQIELLQSRNLKIGNKKRLKWYLENFNYHNFVNAYNDFFMINEDRKKNVYKNEIDSEMLISWFNFDRKISSDFLPYILTIERKLSTLITYHILNTYKKKMEYLKYGEILKLNDDDLLEIFPGLNKYDIKSAKWSNKINNIKINTLENIEYFKKLISQDSKEKEICKTYQDPYTIPLWTLSINWSMGLSIKIYSLLNNDIQKIITKKFCKNDYDNIQMHFHKVLVLINNVRNKICHGNVLFKVDYKKSNREISSFLINQNYKPMNTNIRLFEIIFLIDLLKPMIKIIPLKQKIKKELSIIGTKNNESGYIEKNTLSIIKQYMNYKK